MRIYTCPCIAASVDRMYYSINLYINLISITALHPGSHNININAAAMQSHSPASPVVALVTFDSRLLLTPPVSSAHAVILY